MSAPTEHALLSASGAERWYNCPPSARLEESMPEETSDYAEEGRLAHALAEHFVRQYFKLPCSDAFNPDLFDGEMFSAAEEYLDHIKSVALGYPMEPYIVLEQRVDFSDVVPDGWGTSDAGLVFGTDLHVFDYKYGKGIPVSAEGNKQEMLYAYGLWRKYAALWNIKTVILHIVQPRLGPPSVWVITLDELKERMQALQPRAQQAYAGAGEFAPGDHCRFCRARRTCAARAAYCQMTDYAEMFALQDPRLLTDAQVGEALARVQSVQHWLGDVEKYVTQKLLDGAEVPGWKLVEGRGARSWIDQDKAFDILKNNGYTESVLFQRVPLSLAECEKLTGKKTFYTILADQIIKTPGKPTLAPESDPREAIKRESATELFEPNETKTEN